MSESAKFLQQVSAIVCVAYLLSLIEIYDEEDNRERKDKVCRYCRGSLLASLKDSSTLMHLH